MRLVKVISPWTVDGRMTEKEEKARKVTCIRVNMQG